MLLCLLRLVDFIFVGLAAANTLLNVDAMGALIQTFELIPLMGPTNSSQILFSVYTTYYDSRGQTAVGEPTENPRIRMDGSGKSISANQCGVQKNEFPDSVEMTCDYSDDVPYIVVMCLFGAYFLGVFLLRQKAASKYSYSDWRYLLYVDQYNSRWPNQVICFAGIVFSWALALTILALTSKGPIRPSRIWNILLFGITNTVLLAMLLESFLARNINPELFEEFDDVEMPITELPDPSWNAIFRYLAAPRRCLFDLQNVHVEGETNVGPGLSRVTTNPEALSRLLSILACDPEHEHIASHVSPAAGNPKKNAASYESKPDEKSASMPPGKAQQPQQSKNSFPNESEPSVVVADASDSDYDAAHRQGDHAAMTTM